MLQRDKPLATEVQPVLDTIVESAARFRVRIDDMICCDQRKATHLAASYLVVAELEDSRVEIRSLMIRVISRVRWSVGAVQIPRMFSLTGR